MSDQTTSEKFTKIEKDLFDIYDMIKELTGQSKSLKSDYEDIKSNLEKVTKDLESESDKTTKSISNVNDSVAKLVNQKLDEMKVQNEENLTQVKNLIEKAGNETKKFKDLIEGKMKSNSESNENKLNEIFTNISENKDSIETNGNNILENKDQLISKIKENSSLNSENLDQLKQELNLGISLQKDSLTTFVDQQKHYNLSTSESINGLKADLDSKIISVNDYLKKQLDEQAKSIVSQNEFMKNQNEFTKNQVSKIFDLIDNHANALKSFSGIYNQLKANIDNSVADLKKDQEILMSSIQKIIMGQIENIRNELLTFSKEIRTNLQKFSDENVSKFTSIKETEQLNEKLRQLENGIQQKSESIQNSVSESIESSIKKFDSAIKKSISSVDEYRVDLERFKDDIESLIERKVNEKTEFSNELFNNLLTKSEHLVQLIRDSQIESTPEIAIPVPGIKDSERSEK